ncbi:MAG TPA: dienelactone hydrolase family protein [Acidimicrobiales bacterium]|nr:dienelactone hydrolase family protein [Acidimicrobiales bacterium]
MHVTLPSGTPAALAKVDGDRVMGLVIATDIFGLRPLFDDMVDRIAAEQQMTVCAPEPFPGQDLPLDLEARYPAVARLRDQDVLRDLADAADATECERVGLIGFCMGGMYALKAAALARFDRIVSFYGMIRLPDAWRGGAHGQPLDALARPGGSAVLAIVGGKDPYTPPADVAALEFAGATVVRYPDADHGFVHDASRPHHRADDAADAWARAWAFLRG